MLTRTPPRYQWASPHDWFDDYLTRDRDRAELANIARGLAVLVDGDQLQDAFHDDMDDDGYFSPLVTCHDCRRDVIQRDTMRHRGRVYCDTCAQELDDDDGPSVDDLRRAERRYDAGED